MANNGSLKSTIAVSLTNYLDAGAIVAGASGLTLWQNYLGLSEVHLGWLNFISANCLGAAVGAIIGGFLADKYGRKFIFTYNLLVYMTGVLLVMLSVNQPACIYDRCTACHAECQLPHAVGRFPRYRHLRRRGCSRLMDLYL